MQCMSPQAVNTRQVRATDFTKESSSDQPQLHTSRIYAEDYGYPLMSQMHQIFVPSHSSPRTPTDLYKLA